MSNAVSRIDITCSDGFYYAEIGRNGFDIIEDFSDETSITAVNTGWTCSLYDSLGNVLVEETGEGYGLISANPDIDSRVIQIGGTSYRDGVTFGAYTSGSYDGLLGVANYVTLEHYLWGVVPNELGPSNPIEALKAQAVSARSYTLSHLDYHGGGALSFDLCYRTHCQAYGGVSSEYPITTKACQETKGLVLEYDGSVASTYYYSTNGGYTMDVKDVWYSSGSYPYLAAVPDPYTGVRKWQTCFTFDELSDKLGAAGKPVGDVISVSVGSRTNYGAVQTLNFTGTMGNVTLSKNQIMDVLSLRSRFFSLDPSEFKEVGLVTASNVSSGGNASVSVLGQKLSAVVSDIISVFSKNGGSETTVDSLVVYDGKTTSVISGGNVVTTSDGNGFEDTVCNNGYAYFSGIGNGHGVGLCQTGATNRANAGFTYDEILNAYFIGAEIVQHNTLGY